MPKVSTIVPNYNYQEYRLPEMNFDDFGIVLDYTNNPQYEDAVEKLLREKGSQADFGLMAVGQALNWSANIIHGGSRRKDRRLTWQSQVTHYYFSRCKYRRPGNSSIGALSLCARLQDSQNDIQNANPRFAIRLKRPV